MLMALQPMNQVVLKPREYPHTEAGLDQMAHDILRLGEDTRVIMEATGRYHEPVAAALHEHGIRVTVMNPLFIKQSGGGSIRKVKTDKADAKKIAKYGLDNWMDFIMTFWHCECIALISEAAFTERYRKWCKRKGYHFSDSKAADLYIDSIGPITTLPKNSNTKLIITTAAAPL